MSFLVHTSCSQREQGTGGVVEDEVAGIAARVEAVEEDEEGEEEEEEEEEEEDELDLEYDYELADEGDVYTIRGSGHQRMGELLNLHSYYLSTTPLLLISLHIMYITNIMNLCM